MSAAFRIAHTNAFADAVLAVTSEVATMPATHLQNSRRDSVWRSTSLATQTIYGHWNGDERTVGHFGIYRHLMQGAQVQLRLFSDQAGTSLVLEPTDVDTSGVMDLATNVQIGSHTWGADSSDPENTDLFYYEQPFALWFAMTTCKSFRITISGTPDNGNSYFQATSMFLGPYFEPVRAPGFGVPYYVSDNSLRDRSGAGSNLVTVGAQWVRVDIDMNSIPRADAAIWRDLMRWLGPGRDAVLAVTPPDSDEREIRDYTLFGKFDSADPLIWSAKKYRSKKWSFQEN